MLPLHQSPLFIHPEFKIVTLTVKPHPAGRPIKYKSLSIIAKAGRPWFARHIVCRCTLMERWKCGNRRLIDVGIPTR